MIKKHRFLLGSIVASVLVFALGCPPATTPEVVEEKPDEPDVVVTNDTATIEGRLESEIGPVAGARVLVYRVLEGGSLQNIIVDTPQTDAQGFFSVTINLEDGPIRDFIVEAQPQTEGALDDPPEPVEEVENRGRVIGVEHLESGGSIVVAPINHETTVEADVFLNALATGEWDQQRNDTPGLRALITPQMASSVVGGGQYGQDIELLARAVTAGMKTWTNTLLREARRDEDQPPAQQQPGQEQEDEVVDTEERFPETFSEDDVQNARDDIRTAQVEFDQRLHETTDVEERVQARNQYLNEHINAYDNNNINIHHQARVAQAAIEAQQVYFGDLSDGARVNSRTYAETMRAFYVTRSVNEAAGTLGVDGERLEAIEQAGTTLQTSMAGLAEGEVDLEARIQEGWNNYQQAVETQLQLELEEPQRVAYQEVQSNIEVAHGQLEQAVEGLTPQMGSTAVADTTSQAVPEVYTLAMSETNFARLLEADIDENSARALLEVAFQFSMAPSN